VVGLPNFLKNFLKFVQAVPRHLTTSRAQFWSRLLAFVFVPTHIGACLMSYYMLAKMNDTAAQDLAGHFMLLASTGVSSAVGSASAHELIHSRWDWNLLCSIHLDSCVSAHALGDKLTPKCLYLLNLRACSPT